MNEIDWTDEIPITIDAISSAQFALLEANMALPATPFETPDYADRIAVIDAAVLKLTRGKWLYNRATGECAEFAKRTRSREDVLAAQMHLAEAEQLADLSHAPTPAVVAEAKSITGELSFQGTETLYYQGVPVVPSICPIVLLRGTSREMGAQYVEQCVQIFGRFVLEHVAERPIVGEVLEVIRHWEKEMRRHTPELLEMARGMVEGARNMGFSLSYEHAISLWTDILPPVTEPMPFGVLDAEAAEKYGGYIGRTRLPAGDIGDAGTCSGAAAWGTATQAGRSCFASSTDHDCTFQVTIIAYPDDGIPFVYTPFSVNGSIPNLGRFGLSGHPGLNAAGVAYVHHGGYESCAEPKETWGYGVPRGATTMHILRYARSARQALEMELSFPVGNTGRILGTASGFYADNSYAYVLEDRTPGRHVVREHTFGLNGEKYEFLYATNNLLSPELAHGFCPPPDGYSFEVDTGWYTFEPQKLGNASPGVISRQVCTLSSFGRNRYLHRRLSEKNGALTPETLADIFSIAPQFHIHEWLRGEGRKPKGSFKEASVGGRHNAFVSYGEAGSGRYSAAIGMVAPRNASTNGPAHGFFYYDETGQYWDVRLSDNFESLVSEACEVAEQEIARAEKLLQDGSPESIVSELQGLLGKAKKELRSGLNRSTSEEETSSNQEMSAWAFKCRCFTRAQVRARQVISAVQHNRVPLAAPAQPSFS